MKNKANDTFEASKNNIFNVDSNLKENFFLSNDSFIEQPANIKKERQRRLNDYDFNLLKEDAYKDVSDDLFKLEYKISKTEEEIAYLSCQIQAAKEINDIDLLNDLTKQKDLANEDYTALVALYHNKSISARVSESIASIFSEKLKNKYYSKL